MKIAVCVKQVAKIEGEPKIDDSGTRFKEDFNSYDLNEFDSYALEEAVRLKEKHGGEVHAVTIGPERAREVLFTCLARGADNAVHLKDPLFLGQDHHGIALILASVIKRSNFDLVLTGTEAEDDPSAYVGAALAEHLDIPHVSAVTKAEVLNGGKSIRVHREMGGGVQHILEVSLPALLTIQTGIEELRYATVLKIVQAKRKEIRTFSPTELEPNAPNPAGASKMKLVSLAIPESRKKLELISGRPEDVAKQLIWKLKDEAKVI